MANFATGKVALTEKAKKDVALQAKEIHQFSYKQITVEGHADSSGNASINKTADGRSKNRRVEIFIE